MSQRGHHNMPALDRKTKTNRRLFIPPSRNPPVTLALQPAAPSGDDDERARRITSPHHPLRSKWSRLLRSHSRRLIMVNRTPHHGHESTTPSPRHLNHRSNATTHEDLTRPHQITKINHYKQHNPIHQSRKTKKKLTNTTNHRSKHRTPRQERRTQSRWLQHKDLVIGVSSSALLDLTESDHIYRSQGVKAYEDYQTQHSHDHEQPHSTRTPHRQGHIHQRQITSPIPRSSLRSRPIPIRQPRRRP